MMLATALPQPQPLPRSPPDIGDELAAASAAMATHDFDAAEQVLAEAMHKAEGGPLEPRVRGWQELLHYARGFDDMRRQAIAEVTSGNEYDTPAGKVAIVESGADTFSFRAAGKTVRRTPATIPRLVLEAIVTDWLDDRPANQLFLGAYHATKAEPDFDAAREAWQKAATAGVDASVLLPLLDDPLIDPVLAAP